MFYHFFFNDTATTEIYTLSLHDALPISAFPCRARPAMSLDHLRAESFRGTGKARGHTRSGPRTCCVRSTEPPRRPTRQDRESGPGPRAPPRGRGMRSVHPATASAVGRSEEHTSELQSLR